jgi:hypothetical protein
MSKEFEINLFPSVNVLLEEGSQSETINWLETTMLENQGGLMQIAFHL